MPDGRTVSQPDNGVTITLYRCPFTIAELSTPAFLREIENSLASDSYYDTSKGSFREIALKTGEVIKQFLFYDQHSHLLSKYNDKVYFGPDNRHIVREGLRTALIKYAAHFVTSGTPRSLDNQKVRNLSNITFSVTNGVKYLTTDSKEDPKIHFVFEFDKKNNIVTICDGIICANGYIRIITCLPEQKRNRIDKKIASGEYQEATNPQQLAAESTQLPSLESTNSGSISSDDPI